MIPLLINLKDQPVLVVGGGLIATRRVLTLLGEAALVTCVSLEISAELKTIRNKRFVFKQKRYEAADLEKNKLVVAATDDPGVNEVIKRDCQKLAIPCSRVDCHQDSDVLFPAVIRRGKLTLAVCTEGASPALSKEIVRLLAAQYDESYIEKIELLDSLRDKLRKDNRDCQLRQIINYSVSELRQLMKDLE